MQTVEFQQQQSQLTRFLGFLESDPANQALLQQAADLAYQLGQYELAGSLIERVLVIDPDNGPTLMLQGLLLMSQSRFPEAESTFRQLQALDEGAPQIAYNLAYVLLLQKHYADAEEPAKQAAQHLDMLPQAASLYTQALHFNGKVDEAIDFCLSTLDQHPQLTALHGQLATLYLDNEAWEQAQEHAQYTLNTAPDDADALTVMGNISLMQQDAEQAQQQFQHAILVYPNNGRAWAGKAMAEMLRGALPQAEADLKQALSSMPEHIGTWHALAWSQILQQKPAEAEQSLLEALRLNRNFAETHGGLAVVALMSGKTHEAQQATTRALKLDPMCFSGLYAQSLLLQSHGQPAQAQSMINDLMQRAVLPDGTTLQQAVVRMVNDKKPAG